MKVLRIIIPLVIIVLVLICALIYILRNTKSHEAPAPKVYEGTLIEFNHNPGYGDECGALHDECLRKNDSGEWTIECRDLEYIGEPMVITTYEVSSDDVLAFETFVKESGILDLQNRSDSDEFMTDYRPWNYSMCFNTNATEGSKREYFSFSQYLKYSDADRALIKELNARFEALRGKIISIKKTKDY